MHSVRKKFSTAQKSAFVAGCAHGALPTDAALGNRPATGFNAALLLPKGVAVETGKCLIGSNRVSLVQSDHCGTPLIAPRKNS